MSYVTDIFLKLVSFDTQSDHDANCFPSTAKQMELARFLSEECKRIGLADVGVDSHGYVTATLKSTLDKKTPVIAFLAHMDTSPDCSGQNVKPQLIKNYNGKNISLSNGLVLSPEEFPHLKNYVGQDLITTDGTTLLGADDKAGIAEILGAMKHLAENPSIPHGTVRICFTPDEEVGHGVDHLDIKALGADFGYTIDGGELGELEYENFNAARAKITIRGKSVHPGYAKNIMQNAGMLAIEVIQALPNAEQPATTDKYQGYYHLHAISGSVEKATIAITLRDFEKQALQTRKDLLKLLVKDINKKYGREAAVLEIWDEYANMYEIISQNMHVFHLAEKAMQELSIPVKTMPIRGGTDGCRLSFMGLPCPNLFTGGHNAHGPYEYIPIPSMEKCVDVIVNICRLANNEY